MPSGEEEDSGERFDEGVAEAVVGSAAARFAAQDEPAKDGDVVVGLDRLTAGTGGAWADDGFFGGYSIDAYV